ncbi:MAG: hypothetical protein ABSA44_10450 [Bacteroidota bacterium]|jgi:hypothetical protein
MLGISCRRIILFRFKVLNENEKDIGAFNKCFQHDFLICISFIRLFGKGYAEIYRDASKDKRGSWWALIKRCVSKDMNLGMLSKPHDRLCVEAFVRTSDVLKRINLHLNTNRTKDFHSRLMEYEIPDTTNWYTINITTHHVMLYLCKIVMA